MVKQTKILISCGVFDPIFKENGFETGFDEVIYLDTGLHPVPKKLREALQDRIDQIKGPSFIVLGYGLCGNGLDGIKAGIHTLLVPKADDCIMLFMGSREKYLEEHRKDPGTYFLTRGWLDSGDNPFEEYKKIKEKYGEETALWIMDQQYRNYNRLIFVAHDEKDFVEYQDKIQPVADFCSRWDMRYQEYLGTLDFIHQLLDSPREANIEANDQLIVVPPGEVLTQKDFLPL